MLISKFKDNSPLLFIPLFFVAALFWLDAFIFYQKMEIIQTHHAPLYALMAPFFINYPFWGVVTGFLLMLGQAFYFNKVITDKNLVDRNSYLPALLYIVLMSTKGDLAGPHPIWFANTFLLLAIDKIFDVFSEDDIFIEIFNVGFLIGIAAIFYYPALWFFVLALAALIIYYVFNLRAVLASLLGLVTPFLFVGLYFYWFDVLDVAVLEFLSFYQNLSVPPLWVNWSAKLSLMLMGLTGVIALVKVYFDFMRDKPIRIRKRLQILFIILGIAIVSGLFSYEYYKIHIAIIFLPMSAIFAVFFQENKNRFWNEILFSLMLILIAIDILIPIN